MLMLFWSEISRMFLFCVFWVDYFEAEKCVFYSITTLLKWWLSHEITHEGWYAIKQKTPKPLAIPYTVPLLLFYNEGFGMK